ncbi:helix-turn-helix domain-containing protein [Streptomyces sp. NPDC005202]|uniref:helix-turn-helix domain-containing protein n=1 Tax=Streptomyces sp. NPDC005202 TaxID=3157021 RepID=UPI0033B5EB8E
MIGQARLVLLTDLGSPRTTTELAERQHMSASTVSYHLLRLHRVGLLNRMREGSRVYYQRTSEADRLVTRGRCAGPGRRPAPAAHRHRPERQGRGVGVEVLLPPPGRADGAGNRRPEHLRWW